MRAGTLDSDIYHYEYLKKNLDSSVSAPRTRSGLTHASRSPHLQTPQTGIGPVTSGLNEAGMLFQSQDIDVRAAAARVCERALRKVVGRRWLPINHSSQYECTFFSQLHHPNSEHQ